LQFPAPLAQPAPGPAVFQPTAVLVFNQPRSRNPLAAIKTGNPAAETCCVNVQGTSMSESFAALFEESLQRAEMRAGEVITAEVVRIEHNHVVVNAGLKSEAYVPIDEFKNDQGEVEVQVGDFVSVAIDAIENGYGDTILSRDKAKRLASWMSLEKALESGEFVTGTTTGKVKGGLTVLVNGIRAFLPGSLIDTRPIKDLSPYENKTLEFKVIKLDRKRNNVVLSRRAVVEASMGEERAKLMETLKEGSIVRGVVKNITEYGAFVDLGGIDGLLHITDMAWRRVRHPSEVVTAGQEITAKILKFDTEKNRVSLGLKQMGDDPWMGVSAATRTAPACSARSPTSPTTARSWNSNPASKAWCTFPKWTGPTRTWPRPRSCPLGDEVEVMVLEIDEDKRRISLGMKQCKANPWQEFAQDTKRGDRVKGPIKSITDFGVFVGLAAGIDGLVHLSDLSWNEPGEAAVRNYKKGQEVEAIVLAVDVDRERISLGIKQLDSDPFTTFTSVNDKGSVVTGKVKTVDPKGAEIDLGDDIMGYLRASEISRDRVEDARNVLKEGDEVTAVVVNVDRKTRNIQLSIKAKDMPTSRARWPT
jgi:small subunit ribosomal protein S1